MELPFIEMERVFLLFLRELLEIKNLVFRYVKFIVLYVFVFCAAKPMTTNLIA